MEGYSLAELSTEELEVIQELEQTLSHIKGRYIVLIAYDLGETEEYEEEFDEASFVSFPRDSEENE